MDIQQTLIRACINGDRRAEHQLFTITYSYLMSICIRYTGQPEKAQEVFNMGFYRILKGLRSYDLQSPFKPWARTIMINTLINEYKKEKIHYKTMYYVEDYDERQESPDLNESLGKFDVEYIYGCIAQLPLATQHVFNLYIDGYKHKDIAALLGINESTSRWHVADAKVRLRELIRNYADNSNIYS
jgi:RNA polymerase sigma factor (sigma-70 family)